MTRRCVLVLVSLFLVGCSDDNGPSDPEVWTSESLHSGLEIAFPEDYEGDGVWCGMDACWFVKSRTDDAVLFHISVFGMTGGLPEHFDEMPAAYLYPNSEAMTTSSGLAATFFSQLEGDPDPSQCRGTFVVAEDDGDGFVEAVRVTYSSTERDHVKEILRTIAY